MILNDVLCVRGKWMLGIALHVRVLYTEEALGNHIHGKATEKRFDVQFACTALGFRAVFTQNLMHHFHTGGDERVETAHFPTREGGRH